MPPPLDLAGEIALRLVIARDDDLDTLVTESLASMAHLADVDRARVTRFDDDGTFENGQEWTASHVVPHRPAVRHLRATRFR